VIKRPATAIPVGDDQIGGGSPLPGAQRATWLWDGPGGPWNVVGYFVDTGDRYELSGIAVVPTWTFSDPEFIHPCQFIHPNVPDAVKPRDAWPAITARVLRSLPMREAAAGLRQNFIIGEGAADGIRQRVRGRTVDEMARKWKPSRAYVAQRRKMEQGIKPRYGDDHYKEVAELYRTTWQNGGHPSKAVANAYKVKSSTARTWIRRCRDLGLLPVTDERTARA
jgi:hypothetical protein